MPSRNPFVHYATRHHGIAAEALKDYNEQSKNMTRSVIEERSQPFREIDVFSRLIMDRIIFLGSGVDSRLSNVIIAQLLFLTSVDPKKSITMYINSPGGSIYAGLGIYDTMQYIEAPVATVCVGLGASMGAILLAGGEKGKRAALPHARMMIHQPLGGMEGQMSDMEITVKQIKSLGDDLYRILGFHTGKTAEQVKKDGDRDYWMTAQEAKNYHLIDQVMERKSTPSKK